MIKKTSIISIVLILFFPINAFASVSREYYPPADSDFYKKKISYQLYIPNDVVKLKITQYTPLPEQDVKEVIEWDVKPNSFIWVDMWCKGDTKFEYLTENGEVDSIHVRAEGPHLNSSETCPSPSVTLSDFNEEENRYAGDTFGGKADKLDNPDPEHPDGSGGTGESGYIGDSEDNGNDSGSGDNGGSGSDSGSGTGSGDGSNSENCGCIFETPGWNEYMDKLDEIASKIPSPPNWEQVADTFYEQIVPKVISDLENMLGTAPEPPVTPSKPSGVDDQNILDKTPTFQDNPELDSISNQMTSEQIKNTAPEIPVKEDESGGFDLLTDPVDSLPDFPSDDFPIPGQTDPGEWGENKPEEQDNPYPEPPKDSGNGEIENPPIPEDSGETPPSPGDDVGNTPVPGDNSGTPPTPGEDEGWKMRYYKPSPDLPDGSGEEWNP